MSILSIPSGVVPNNLEWALKSNSAVFTSSLTGVTQTAPLPGDRWTAMLTFANRVGVEARQIRAFLSALRGMSGRFYLTPYDHPTPSGVATGAPLVKGALQTGATLLIDGCTSGISGWLLAGDYFQIGNELKMVTADCNTNGSGETTLHFVPPIRTSPADNSAIIVNNPTCIMQLADDSQAKWSAHQGKIYAMTIACQEPLDI